jgi:hypothetical protein
VVLLTVINIKSNPWNFFSLFLFSHDFTPQPYFQIQHCNDIEALELSINLLNEQFYKEVSCWVIFFRLSNPLKMRILILRTSRRKRSLTYYAMRIFNCDRKSLISTRIALTYWKFLIVKRTEEWWVYGAELDVGFVPSQTLWWETWCFVFSFWTRIRGFRTSNFHR